MFRKSITYFHRSNIQSVTKVIAIQTISIQYMVFQLFISKIFFVVNHRKLKFGNREKKGRRFTYARRWIQFIYNNINNNK